VERKNNGLWIPESVRGGGTKGKKENPILRGKE
jgi:hypothetical protein